VQYTVKAGETVSLLAIRYGVSVEQLRLLNPTLGTLDNLTAGQIVILPETPSSATPSDKLIPDSELVNSPDARGFDVATFIREQPGFLRAYSELVYGRYLTGAQIVDTVAQQQSVNPRLLLTLLEMRGKWLTDPSPTATQIDYPLGDLTEARKGLFRQLGWAAAWLNDGYYGWKHRGLNTLIFTDQSRLAYSSQLNAGSVAVQYFLARTAPRSRWTTEVNPDSRSGFAVTYRAFFGDPFRDALDPLIPANLSAPPMGFPFPKGEIWYYTGGPHGGWDAASGWAGIDFAPPAPPDDVLAKQGACYVSPFFATAMVAGVIARSGDGVVVIDLDGDGDERTGWAVSYLHIAAADSVSVGTRVAVGDRIGRPSCEGFNLSAVATHLHISRRYHGEWIPADCWACPKEVAAPAWELDGWRVRGIPRQIFQGTLERNGELRQAEQGRDIEINQVIW
jgi:murein DD-endopeptidase MepM/ murein hydrolase activator NlpD